jgi:2-hydroxymuconate-semialdehyde hydrolase
MWAELSMVSYQSKTFTYEDVPVHYLEGGEGLPLLLIHGSGPGASTIGNWRMVLEPLVERYHVFAMDLIGFGQSGRRRTEPYFDIDFWLGQCRAMIALMPGEEIGICGHSLSGALALKLAAIESRITRILTTGTMGAPFPVNNATIRCWTFPTTRQDLIETARILIHDERHITDAYIENRVKTLFDDIAYKNYFTKMFAGDPNRFVAQAVVTPEELAANRAAIRMLHGRNDTAFPPSVTLKLAESLPQADVTLLASCSHSIALEQPEQFLAAANELFGVPLRRK